MRNKSGNHSDDISDMDKTRLFSDRDADALLSGRAPSDPSLMDLHRALASIKSSLVVEPNVERASVFAVQLASVAATLQADAAPAPRRGAVASPWRRRVAAVIAVAAISGFGVAGAAAADEAAPGDLMYGVDQALESVGILDGGTGERVHEAQKLLDGGDVEGALELTGDALESDGHVEAATGLRNAALAVASQSSGDDLRAQVSAMLEWMAGQDSRGAEFGAAVSERARQISGNANENANENANGNENADGNANGDANGNANGNVIGDGNDNAVIPADPGSQGRVPETRGTPD